MQMHIVILSWSIPNLSTVHLNGLTPRSYDVLYQNLYKADTTYTSTIEIPTPVPTLSY